MNKLDRKFVNDAADAAYDKITAAFVKSVAAYPKNWLVFGFVVPWGVIAARLVLLRYGI